jgi:hypothetical protein
MHQNKYLTLVLVEYQILITINIPMQFDIGLSTNTIHHLKNKKSTNLSYFHSQLVRSLINTIVNNKPNCSFVISSLAQYLVNLDEVHVQVLRRTMCYIKRTLSFGIKYQRCIGGNILHGYFYADWVGDKNTCCFTLT